MVTSSQYQFSHSSVSIEPLHIHKSHSSQGSNALESSSSLTIHQDLGSSSSNIEHQITPPATPNGSQEELVAKMENPEPIFHNFLRAFYPFHPASTVTDSTITLPLNEGDVILVHSIHTNGWADGTLLLSGARGWLPTNYCEAYDPENMKSLLQALLNFWDLLKCGVDSTSEIFGNQEFMRGIIAGVRHLLDKSNCLTRDSASVQANDSLRRTRKALLSDLSSLVKTAKRLSDFADASSAPKDEDVNDIIDEMILKAFKTVVRGVRFLDVHDDFSTRQQAKPVIPIINEEGEVPPTPPADTVNFADSTTGASDVTSLRSSSRGSMAAPTTLHHSEEQVKRYSNNRLSGGHLVSQSRPASVQINRLSVSHRMSLLGCQGAAKVNLVSQRLNTCHDAFLSYMGSFIGRLHLQSQSSTDLLVTTRQCVSAGRNLLTVIEAVCVHDAQSADMLQEVKDIMYERINHLVLAARDIISDEEDVVMLQETKQLMDAATDCVKATGDCVARTKFVIERIGDFEFDPQVEGLGLTLDGIAVTKEAGSVASEREETEQQEQSTRPSPPRLVIPSYEKPLPQVPSTSSATSKPSPIGSSRPVAYNPSSTTSSVPPIFKSSPIAFQDDYSPSDNSNAADYQSSFDSNRSTANSGVSTYMNGQRGSETSIISQTSTRATTPDTHPYRPHHKASFSDFSATGSQTHADDLEEAESKLLEKTFAHELIHNKDGQITGGTLPALVERLTTHDTTPDATFVSTFYLTFRLFVSPIKLAEALVERFDYVAETPRIAAPVRLRVYNAFKGWIESHWRPSSDSEALETIKTFADGKLKAILPAAGKRLAELVEKASSTEGQIVPRLLSSIGRTNTSTSHYVSAETPLPPPAISKSQMNILRNFKAGATIPSILDFEPLEIARQLTIKDMNIFCSILPEELLDGEWMKKSGSVAVNVRGMSAMSTDISNLVADTILQYDDAKKRALVIKQWIKIAHKCLELNNYDTLMAIICSLNSSTIQRLKKTWDMVSPKRKEMLKSLQAIVEPTKNYATLRQRIQGQVAPCLPFPGTYLTDLTFNDLGNPALKQLPGVTEGGRSVINFDKHMRTAKIIGELQRFQVPYRLTEVPDLQDWISAEIARVKSSDQSSVQKYYRKSLLLEPRTAAPQKPSPIENQASFSSTSSTQKEKFDLFGWAHSRKDPAVLTAM